MTSVLRAVSDRARSFETVAAEYERHRPDYPVEALRWAAERLGLDRQARVLDVGAGTGKLTRALVALGFEVVPVEPGAPMLEQLRAAVPEAEALEGQAEAIPLPDESVDAAFAGQAFHSGQRRSSGNVGGRSSRPCRKSSPDGLIGYLATSSMFLTMEAGERERRLGEVRAVAARYGGRFPLPRLTYVFAFARLGDG